MMMMKDFWLRPANNDDITAVKQVVFSVLQEYGLKHAESGKDKDLNDIEKSYFCANGYFGVVINIHTDQVVGTFGLYALDHAVCELRKMYLLKSARGKGLGKFMLRSAIEIAKEMHYTKIILETISPLKEAISLYKQNGFTEVEPKEINDRVDQAFELNIG